MWSCLLLNFAALNTVEFLVKLQEIVSAGKKAAKEAHFCLLWCGNIFAPGGKRSKVTDEERMLEVINDVYLKMFKLKSSCYRYAE